MENNIDFSKHSPSACYRWCVEHGRNDCAEKVINSDPFWHVMFLENIQKSKEGAQENLIASCGHASFAYSIDVLCAPFLLGEEKIKTIPQYWRDYCLKWHSIDFANCTPVECYNWSVKYCNTLEADKVIATSAEFSFKRAYLSKTGIFKLGEKAIAESVQWSYYYSVYCLRKKFNSEAISNHVVYGPMYKEFLKMMKEINYE